MFGIIFTIFFFVLGLFEFFGSEGSIQNGLMLFLISSIYYIGYSILGASKLKVNNTNNLVKTISDTLIQIMEKSGKIKNDSPKKEEN